MLYSYKKNKITKKIKTNYKIKSTFNKKTNLIIILICSLWAIAATIYIFPYINSYEKYLELGDKYVANASSQIKSLTLPDLGSYNRDLYSLNASKKIQNTSKEISLTPKLHPELEYIQGTMTITIPKIEAHNIPIQINVDSTNEEVYMPILNTKLAHFRGTALPGYTGNIFIYGHSINEFWSRFKLNHPSTVFTNLDKLDIGDEIIINYQNKEYKYKVNRARIVSPEDLSSIYSRGSNTVTLMTCWPPGIGSERLIVVAQEINNN